MPPLVTHPTWIFLVMLLVILLAPAILRRLHIPHIIGLILAGLLIGPGGLNILDRDASFELFGQVGIYYIMFLAGLEMDMGSFRRHGRGGLVLGLFTFLVPFVAGLGVAYHVLGLGLASSALLSCLLASHTLVTFPIVGRYGLGKHPSVVYSIVATAFASFTALLLLAVVIEGAASTAEGYHVTFFSYETYLSAPLYWLLFAIGIGIYLLAVILILPRVGRWFLRRNEDAVTQYIFILALVFICAWMAEKVGLEGLLGAFLAGLVLNRIIPHGGPLMVRIEFVGNAIFIPYFLIGVGMIIDLHVLFDGTYTLLLSAIVIATAIVGKWLAAWLAQRCTHTTRLDRILMFGLTNSHAAGALAIVMIGKESGLMDASMLNATVLLILVSCIVSSLATSVAARKLALETTELERNQGSYHGKCLTAYGYTQSVETLTGLAIMLRNPHIADSLMGIAISTDDDPDDAIFIRGKDNLEQARRIAAAAGVTMSTMCRISSNVAQAITHTMREVDAGEVILGLHTTPDGKLTGRLGFTTESILSTTHREVLLVRLLMPLGTIRRIVVVVPPKAEYEVGFYKWLEHLCRIGELTGTRMCFHTCGETGRYIEEYLHTHHPIVRLEMTTERGLGHLLVHLPAQTNPDHLVVFVSSRAGFISHTPAMNTLPAVIARSFSHASVILLYPDQFGDPGESLSIFAPNGQTVTQRQLFFEQTLRKFTTRKP